MNIDNGQGQKNNDETRTENVQNTRFQRTRTTKLIDWRMKQK